jgi:hypothetical protein
VDIVSVIALVSTALAVTKEAAAICSKYRDQNRSIITLQGKADRLSNTLDLVVLALETRRSQLERRCGQVTLQPFELREKQIWEKLEEVIVNCRETAETFKRETRKLQPVEGLCSRLVQFWKSSYQESAFGSYEREIDGHLSTIQMGLTCLSP